MSEQEPQLDPETERLIKELNTGGGAGLGREASKAKLEALHVAKVSVQLSKLTDNIFSAQKVLGTRLDELARQIENARDEVRRSSDAANRHSAGLVLWTKRSVAALAIYVVLTGGLLLVGWEQLQFAQQSLQVQIQPEVKLTLDGEDLVVANVGSSNVVNVYVNPSSFVFATAPENRVASAMRYMPKVPGREAEYWWHLEKLPPAGVQRRNVRDLAKNILKLEQLKRDVAASNKIKKPYSLVSFIQFTAVFHRDVDRREYRQSITAYVGKDSVTGEPIVWDAEMMKYGIGVYAYDLQKLGR